MELTNKQIVLISFILVICAILIGENAFWGGIGLLLILLTYIYGERFILALVIISLFTLVGDVGQSLRTFVQIIDFSLLGYLFLKRFGLRFYSYPRIPRFLVYFLLLYYFSMIASSVMSDYPISGLGLIARQTVFFVIVYLFYALINDEKDIRNYFLALTIASFILASSSILSFAIEGSFFTEGIRSRFTGLIGNPDVVSAFYMISIPLILSFLFRYKKKSIITINILLLLFFSLALFLTISRSAFLGVYTSTVIMFYILKRRYFKWLIISTVVLVLAVVLFEPLNEIITLSFRIESGLAKRDYLWATSVDIIKDYPVFGIGPGAYKYIFFNYFPVMLNSGIGTILKELYSLTDGSNLSHNYFLFLFSELGISGLVVALALPIIYFRVGLKTIKKYKNSSQEIYYFIVALFAGGASMFVRSTVDSIGLLFYGRVSSDLPFWILFGSLIYFYNNSNGLSNAQKSEVKINNTY